MTNKVKIDDCFIARRHVKTVASVMNEENSVNNRGRDRATFDDGVKFLRENPDILGVIVAFNEVATTEKDAIFLAMAQAYKEPSKSEPPTVLISEPGSGISVVEKLSELDHSEEGHKQVRGASLDDIFSPEEGLEESSRVNQLDGVLKEKSSLLMIVCAMLCCLVPSIYFGEIEPFIAESLLFIGGVLFVIGIAGPYFAPEKGTRKIGVIFALMGVLTVCISGLFFAFN